MSSTISTHDELSSNAARRTGRTWRVVEAQHRISTAKLTDDAAEQKVLEDLIEASKPPIPAECRHLHFLLSTPFRYGAPYPIGSRFRRAGFTPGVFYSSEHPHTAIAEICFHRILFFAESPDTNWPSDAGEYTVFAVDYAAQSIDITIHPFDSRLRYWMHPNRYEECQILAELARNAGIQMIKYASVQDRYNRPNHAISSCQAFTDTEPITPQTWRLLFGSNGARALREMPSEAIDFDRRAFAVDPRILIMRWNR
jgi:RES domain